MSWNPWFDSLKKKYATPRKWWQKLLGYCPCCKRYFRYFVTTKRRYTAYCSEADNYLTACRGCHKEDFVYFAELWLSTL